MNREHVFLLGLILILLSEMIPMLPTDTTFFSAIVFVIYMILARVKVDRAYITWMMGVSAFFFLSSVWALSYKNCMWVLFSQQLPIFIGTLATYSFLSHNPDGIKKILWTYFVAAVILLLFVLTNINQIEEGVRLGNQLNEDIADGGSRINVNSIGMCICYAIYVGYILFVSGKKNLILRLIAIAIGAWMVYLVLLTGSRKALFMLVIPLIFFSIRGRKKGKILFVLPIALGVIIFGYNLLLDIPFLYEVLGSRVEDLLNIATNQTKGTEDISRLMLVEYGLDWFKERPILGYGINNFRILSNNTAMFAGKNFYSHNNYIELLVGVGIVGFLIYYSCYYYFWKHLHKRIVDSHLYTWAAALLVVLLFLDTAQVSYYAFIPNLIICVCFFIVEKDKKEKNLVKRVYEANRHHSARKH